MCEFASVVEAVACAVAIQAGMAGREPDVPAAERIRFRIGVNVGDVIVEGEEIYGDGVNVAARLEGVAEPGGVCVSGKVHDEVRGKLDLGFEDLGELSAQEHRRPVRAWRVADVAAVAEPTPPRVARRLAARDGDELRDLSRMLDALLIRFGGVLTERSEALDRLAASEARYNALVSTQNGFVARMTPSLQLGFVSDAYCRYYTRSRDELLWRSINEFTLTVPEDRERDRVHLCSLTPEHPANAIRLRRKLPDGSVRWVEWTDTGLFDGEGRLVELQSAWADTTDGITNGLALEENRAGLHGSGKRTANSRSIR